MPDDSRFDRRRFFRQGLRELLKPLTKAVEPFQEALKQFEDAADKKPRTNPPNPKPAGAPALPNVWLRPPGAMNPDMDFRETCSRCRKCVEVCPVQCIQIDTTGGRGDGAPFIRPDEQACVACEGLKCMHHCPTGALMPIPLSEVNMGTALWNEPICLRSKGENCTICIDVCPIGEYAITLRDGKVHVNETGCIGCGTCQEKCPTEPKSIIVLSREVWESKKKA